jgi:hypothetical protein
MATAHKQPLIQNNQIKKLEQGKARESVQKSILRSQRR